MAEVALVMRQGVHQVFVAGIHGAAGALLLGCQPGQDATLYVGEVCRSHSPYIASSSTTSKASTDHRVDALGFHARQVRPHLVAVVLAEVMQQHGAVDSLRHGQPGGQHVVAEATLETLAGGHRASYRFMNSYLITGGVRAEHRLCLSYEFINLCYRRRVRALPHTTASVCSTAAVSGHSMR